MATIGQVKDLEPRVQYTGINGQTIYVYPFPIFDEKDLVVDIDGTILVLNVDYTVTGVTGEDGGTIVLTVATTGGEIVTIFRDTAIDRLTDYVENGDFLAETVNNDFDRIILMLQEISNFSGRAIRVALTDQVSDSGLLLSDPDSRKQKFITFDSGGNVELVDLLETNPTLGLGETKILSAGQTIVNLSVINAFTSSFYVSNGNNDRGRLIPQVDYTATGTASIELTESYPDGTILYGISPEFIEPVLTDKTTQNITFYVSNSGNDTNDGQTVSSPFLTIQKAIDRMYEIGDIYPGLYTVNLDSGTYNRARFNDDSPPSRGFITIQGVDVGGHPNVPVTLIKEGATETGFGILISQRGLLKCKNIKFEDWNGSFASTGVRGNSGSWVFTENCHFEDCYDGVGGYENAVIDVKGGIFNDCGYLNSDPGQNSGFAVRGLFNTKFQVGTQNAGTLALGPIIQNCAGAGRAQEGNVGHFDYCTVQDCEQGVRLLANSRLNFAGTEFKRITNSAIYGTQGCYGDTSGTVFGTGSDANGANYSIGHSSSLSTTGITGINTANNASDYIFKTSYPQQTVNNTNNEVIDSFVIKENALNDAQFSAIPSNRIGVRVYGFLTGATDFKRLNLRVGASQNTISFGAGADGNGYYADLYVDFIGTDSQYTAGNGYADNAQDTFSAFLTESTSADITVQLEAVVGNAADSITIDHFEWYQRGF